MILSLPKTRTALLFPKTPEAFRADADAFYAHAASSLETGLDAAAVLQVVADTYLDLGSHLTRWVLDGWRADGKLPGDAVSVLSGKLRGLLEKFGGNPGKLDDELNIIHESHTARLCQPGGPVRWGHDATWGVEDSMRRGACFSTTNPQKIADFRTRFPEQWASLLTEGKEEYPGLNAQELYNIMAMKIVALTARKLRPIYELTGGEDGFSCLQVNPRSNNDSDSMTEQVLFWEDAFRKELGTDNPNIVYKLPSVPAAAKTVEALTAKGIRVCMTLDFTYGQHTLFTDIIEKGSAGRSFVVLMSGTLDDKVFDELEALGVPDAREAANWAGAAVMRKTYANLLARGHGKVSPMGASMHHDHNIRVNFNGNPDLPVYFTITFDVIEGFDSRPQDLTPNIDQPIPTDIMEKLEKSGVFRRAYSEWTGLDPLEDYPPMLHVGNYFFNAYKEMEASL